MGLPSGSPSACLRLNVLTSRRFCQPPAPCITRKDCLHVVWLTTGETVPELQRTRAVAPEGRSRLLRFSQSKRATFIRRPLIAPHLAPPRSAGDLAMFTKVVPQATPCATSVWYIPLHEDRSGAALPPTARKERRRTSDITAGQSWPSRKEEY